MKRQGSQSNNIFVLLQRITLVAAKSMILAFFMVSVLLRHFCPQVFFFFCQLWKINIEVIGCLFWGENYNTAIRVYKSWLYHIIIQRVNLTMHNMYFCSHFATIYFLFSFIWRRGSSHNLHLDLCGSCISLKSSAALFWWSKREVA